MTTSAQSKVGDSLFRPDRLRFWPLQLGGWGIYALLNVLSSIPYRHRPDYLAFRGAFLASSFLASFSMYLLCRILWKRRPTLRIIFLFSLLVPYPLGLLCAAAAFQAGTVFSHVRRPYSWADVVTAAPSGWFALIAWAAFYFGVKLYLEVEKKHEQLLSIERLASQAEMRALRYQLQPHFLFNTLNAISTLVLTGERQVATQMISRLATLLRSTLASPEVHTLRLEDELKLTEEYLEIEHVRFGDRLRVMWDIETSVRYAQVPRFLLQPLVENAVHHGIAERMRGGVIHISAQGMGESLIICVENSLPERASSILNSGKDRTGIGLENVRQRIKEMYGERGSICAGKGIHDCYEVVIKLPVLE